MSRKITVSTVPRSIAVCLIVIGLVCWFGGASLQVRSPTVPDAKHTIPFNNHATTRYLTPVVSILPWAGMLLIIGGAIFSVVNLLYMSYRTGIPEPQLLWKFRFFSRIEVDCTEDGDPSGDQPLNDSES